MTARPLAALALALAGAPAPAGWFGPSTYDECVLANMKGVPSDVAAVAVARSCRARFPPPSPPPEKPATEDERQRSRDAARR